MREVQGDQVVAEGWGNPRIGVRSGVARLAGVRPEIFALWALLVIFGLTGVFGRSLWGPNETREGSMIWDMYRHEQWLVPTMNGEPYLEKPPLLHWTGLALCWIAGGPSEGLLRLPSALFGLGTLALLLLLIRQEAATWFDRRQREAAGWAAALMCGTAAQFIEYSRIVLTDMALTFTVALAMVTFWLAWRRPSRGRWAVFLLATALSFYAKAMIGPIFVWLAVGLFLLLRRRLGLAVVLGAAFIPIVVAVVGPWLIALHDQLGWPAVRFLLWDNQFGRFFTFGDPTLPVDPFFVHKESWHYYLHEVPKYMLPWSGVVGAALFGAWRRWRTHRDPFDEFLACWIIGPMVLLQFSSAKVATYALPLYPPLFALAGMWLVTGHPKWVRGVTRISLAAALLALTALPGAQLSAAWLLPRGVRVGSVTMFGHLWAVAALVAIAIGVGSVIRLAMRGEDLREMVAGPALVAFAVVAVTGVVVPVVEAQRSYRPIVALARDASEKGLEVIIGTSQSRDLGAFNFYLDRRLTVVEDPGEIVQFLRSRKPRGVIMPIGRLDDLRTRLGAIPVRTIRAGARHSLSRTFVLVTNQETDAVVGANLSDSQDDAN